VHALVAGTNADRLAAQICEFRPEVAVVATESVRMSLIKKLDSSGLPRSAYPELLWGTPARVQAATASEVDFVMSAIVGVAGLEATYEAVRLGKQIGLANKEVLVACGRLVMDAADKSGAELIPVDSEHNGAHQCFKVGKSSEVAKLILTASGGPFRNTPAEQLENVTAEEALNHPTWNMGRRITIDAATMMNKGFEVIEACWLFGLSSEKVEVVVHPQSSVHALVEYVDGSVIAQVSVTDMRMPIQYALTYPERIDAPVPRYDWTKQQCWEFAPPDTKKFPLLQLAHGAQEAGGSAACTLNAADEVAVAAFLDGKISFPAIVEVTAETMHRVPVREPESVSAVLEIDRESRRVASELIAGRGVGSRRIAGAR